MVYLLVQEKKKTNNLVVFVNKLEIIDKLKKVGITTFLFPFKDYSVGFFNTYSILDIKEDNAYLFINRIITSEEIDKLKNILNNLPNNIKGIVFDDLGIINIVKDLNIKKILYLNHLANNYLSINYYLEFVDSVILSTDITESEIEDILKNTNKPLCLYTFGHIPIMYSRRLLISNYQDNFSLKKKNNIIIEDKVEKINFRLLENNYGTVFYSKLPYNATSLKDSDNILFNLINPLFLSEEQTIEVINNIINNEDISIPSSRYFLDKKTIYKLRGNDNE